MRRIALATSKQYSALTKDDRLLLVPLAERGFHAEPAVWSDPNYPWSDCDAVILRSCWDYHLRLDEFLSWIASLEQAGVSVWNQPSLLRWNADKIYLRDLERRGVPIIPTFWGDPAEPDDLPALLRDLNWAQAVIKPRVSASAHKTRVTSPSAASQDQELFDELQRGPGVMLQKFMEEVQTAGEWSLMFFAGRFSHAVVKTAKAGDFRVQDEYGGSTVAQSPPAAVLEAADRIMNTLDPTPLYARVDGVESNGQFLLMELELIEPMLFLNSTPDVPRRFADALVAVL